MTLNKASLSPIRLYLDGNVTKAWNIEVSCDFAVLGKVMSNKGRFLVVASWENDQSMVDICLKLTTSKPRFFSSSEMYVAGVL
jgi:hypothetical protein